MIVDTDGHVLSTHDALGADVTGQLEYVRRLESGLSAKAEAMLAPILGHGRAVVRVSADVDFTETSTARTFYDPDGKVKSRESISTESSRGQSPGSGETGTASNVGLSGKGGQGTLSDVETIETEYQNAETVDTIREAPGRINRLTIAAVVELPETSADADPATGSTGPVFTREQVEGIIKQAVGFDESRNDEIEVLAGKMTGIPDLSASIGWMDSLEQLAPLARSASLGIASVIALFLGLMMIRRLKPVVVEVERRESLDPEVRARLADLSEEILQHPEAVSTVLAGWLADQNANAGKTDSSSRRAA